MARSSRKAKPLRNGKYQPPYGKWEGRPRGPRAWAMGMGVALLLPALLLGVLEVGLRLAGFGYPTAFFLREPSGEETFLRTNHAFTFRFFPRALARAVTPLRIVEEIPESTFRIFIFGESAALGDPDPAYGFGRHLQILLEERFPGTRFEVVCTAITAINSHVILPIARAAARQEGDLWIVYMGNNEFIGPYGAATIFGEQAPPVPLVRASLAAKATRIGQAIQFASEGLAKVDQEPVVWEGINLFADKLLHPDDPARERVYETFRVNLEAILREGNRAGVPVLLGTVATNLRDCAPFASLQSDGLSDDQLARWNSLYQAGLERQEAGAWKEALEAYRQAAAIDPRFAELQFRMGICLAQADQFTEARQAFERARDADALAVRADSTINALIREAAGRHPPPSVTLVDCEELLAGAAPSGLPGNALFYEHVHFTLAGNYQLARLFADQVVDSLPDPIRSKDQGTWAGPGACQRKLAATLWDQSRLWSEMKERQATPPFNARAFNAASLAASEAHASQLASRVNPRMDRLVYELALKDSPEDYHLRARFGHYLLLNGDLPEAIRQLQWITEAFPGFEGGHQELGLALFLAKRFSEAEASFNRVLALNPRYEKARLALQLIREQAP